jgi:large subunit ribosomal protein L5
MLPRLLKHYREKVAPKLLEELELANPHQLPRLQKIVVNCGIGDAHKDQKLLDSVIEELTLITAQRPVVTRSRKSISNFSLRQGMPVGVSVTLRRDKMWEFLDRLIATAIPRVRDFRGLGTRAFDGRGNYTLGVREQIIFPEIEFDQVNKIHGLDITFVTTTNSDAEAHALLRELGFPFRDAVPVAVETVEA